MTGRSKRRAHREGTQSGLLPQDSTWTKRFRVSAEMWVGVLLVLVLMVGALMGPLLPPVAP